MIDHLSIAVRDLAAGGRFYEAVLAVLGYGKMIERATTIGFGKKYPDFWINLRPNMATPDPNGGVHVSLRAPDTAAVDAFHAAALAAGATDDGPPGIREYYHPDYYGAYVRDLDGNKICAVCHKPAAAAA